MKNAKKLAVAIASFGAASMCLIGGTFAWYVVSRTGTAVISGTTVSAESGLQVGIRLDKSNAKYDDIKDALVNTYGYTSDDPTSPGTDVYDENVLFAPDSTGNTITADVLRTVYEGEHSNTHNAANRTILKPVTSGAFNDNDSINLKVNPEKYASTITSSNFTDPIYSSESASAGEYIKFDLAFYTKSQEAEIYLDQSTVFDGTYDTGSDATLNKKVLDTLRVGFESNCYKTSASTDTARVSTIYSPSHVLPSLASSTTDVGSRLDLNGDHLYDYTTVIAPSADGLTTTNTFYEKWYGQCVDKFSNDPITDLTSYYRTMDYGSYKVTPGETEPHWEDGADHSVMKKESEVSSGNTNAWEGWSVLGQTSTYISSVTTKTEDMEKMSPAVQKNHGITYYDSVNGTSDKFLTRTSSKDKYCAFITVYIWFEGWDSAAGVVPNGGTFDATVKFVAPSIQASN